MKNHIEPDDGSNVRQRTASLETLTRSDNVDSDERSLTLKREVGLVSGTALIVGTMIGSGIFISPKGVARGSGSVGLSLISWVICGLISMLASLTWMELGTLIPESGAEYAYIKGAYGSPLAFFYAWVTNIVTKPSSLSIIALTCSHYLLTPLFDDGCGDADTVIIKLVAALVICALAAMNCYSVNLATYIQVVFTAAKIIALIIIVIGGIVMLFRGNTQHLSNAFEGTENDIGTFAIGLYNGLWAYDGWNNLNSCTEEIKNPTKNLPRAIMIGIPLVTVLYILVNISYFTVMDVSSLLDSPAVGVTWAAEVLPGYSWVIPVSVALSTFGAANGSLFTSGRLNFVAARNNHMPEILAMVHVKQYTPFPSLVFTSVVALVLLIPGDIESLIDFFSFATWLFYGLTASTCVYMRFATKYKDAKRPVKIPLVIPVLVVLISLFLVIAPIVDDPQIEFLYAALFIVGGVIFYVPLVHYKIHLSFMGNGT